MAKRKRKKVSKKPARKKPSRKPSRKKPTRKPARKPSRKPARKPARKKVSKKPARKKVSKKPARKKVSKKPARKKVSKKPARKPSRKAKVDKAFPFKREKLPKSIRDRPLKPVTKSMVRDVKTREFFDIKTGRKLTRKEGLKRIKLQERAVNFDRQVKFWTKGAKRGGMDFRDDNIAVLVREGVISKDLGERMRLGRLRAKDIEALVKAAFKEADKRKRAPGVKPVDMRPFFDQWFEFIFGLDPGWAEEWREIGT